MSDLTVTFDPDPAAPVIAGASRDHRIASVLLWVLFGIAVASAAGGYAVPLLTHVPGFGDGSLAVSGLPTLLVELIAAALLGIAAIGVRREARIARYLAVALAFREVFALVGQLGWFASWQLRWSGHDFRPDSLLTVALAVPGAVLGAIVLVLLLRRAAQPVSAATHDRYAGFPPATGSSTTSGTS